MSMKTAPKIDFRNAAYAGAAHLRAQWPPDAGAEVAFAGRSNAGKSSAINAIAGRRRLAHFSKTPGRTRQIVFFDLDDSRRLVDLPGYGYAGAPRDLRRHWERFIGEYLRGRECLKGLIIPMDIRRPLTELDRRMLDFCRELSLPAHILLTKADKCSRGAAAGALQKTRAALEGEGAITLQLFSAVKKTGVEEAAARVAELLGA
ncbi:MAG: putative GTP-binding protein EngB [Arenicellales bacterium IbO2]|nr:MAG: putative GTP-binding protein EngB [Arenicellales bacterium IbO2]